MIIIKILVIKVAVSCNNGKLELTPELKDFNY